MKEVVRPGVVLFLITLIAAICLGFVHSITLKPIEEQQAKIRAEAMSKLLPSADEFIDEKPSVMDKSNANTIVNSVSAGYSKGDMKGYVIGVSTKGYGGDMELLVGLNLNGEVEGVKILSHNETPGLGANADRPEYLGQYIGKSGQIAVTKNEPKNKDREIQAVTSATITSRAVTVAVNAALDFYSFRTGAGGR